MPKTPLAPDASIQIVFAPIRTTLWIQSRMPDLGRGLLDTSVVFELALIDDGRLPLFSRNPADFHGLEAIIDLVSI